MTSQNAPSLAPRKRVPAPRIAMLATVAILGSVAALGSTVFRGVTLSTDAFAADAVQQPAGFADTVAKVTPAVISVRVKIDRAQKSSFNGDDSESPDGSPFPHGSPMEKFGQQFGGPNQPHGNNFATGQGSGFLISADGYAVTNNHVVDHATSVEVTTDGGKTYTAKVIGRDQKADLALIKIDGQNDFPFVKFADKAPRIGDWVIAVGNPFGLSETVTAGIVSARGRDIGAGPYDDYIQIDAPINKGNSGGPSFDVEGNVVGVNTAIFSPSGGSVGIGFAIPADTAKMVVSQLKESGHVTRGLLGVQIQPVTQDIADSLGLKTVAGALVAEPQPDSPAMKAGIKSGDIVTAVNGKEIKTANDLARKISEMAPGTTANLTIVRDGAQQTMAVTLGVLPNAQQAEAGTDQETSGSGLPHLGLNLAPAGGGQGVVVTGVDPNGPAAERGVRTGDVILDIGGKTVTSAADLRGALHDAEAGGKHAVLLRVKSGDHTRFVAMPIEKKQG